MHMGLFAVKNHQTGYLIDSRAVCIVPMKEIIANETASNGAAIATTMPGVVPLVLAGLSIFAGML